MNQRPLLQLTPERHMTLALRQSLEVLQMPQLELAAWLLSEMEKNPLLELAAPKLPKLPKLKGRFEADVAAPITLHEHIAGQIRDHFADAEERGWALALMHQLDEKGFLPPHIANSHILHTLQTFDPPGIFARSLQESFLLQLKAKGKEKTLTFTLIEQCYDDLLHGRYGQIRKKLKSEELKKALLDVSRLALRPAHSFQEERGAFLTVDLLIQKVDGGWTIELIEDDLPRVHLRSEYLDVETNGTEEKRALQELRTRAKWVVRSLSRRRKLLLEIGRQLVKTQARFLEQKGPLAPLSSRALAQKLEIHESTLSRALAGKYATTPRGILSLRSLVPTDSESENAKQMLVSLIAAEDKQNPYTDDQLADALKEKGFPIARRTIAKYRNRLKIGSASQRKNQITSLSVY